MTGTHPPRLPLALLRRYLSDNEPLIGDLVEGYAVRGSRWWFWREALVAVSMHAFRRRDPAHPLGLADPGVFPPEPPSPGGRHRTVNLSASPIPWAGGLGLVAWGALVAWVGPGILWIFLPALVGGVMLGVTLVIQRRRAVSSARPHTLLRR